MLAVAMYRTILAVIMNHIAIAMFQDWLQCKAEAHFHADFPSIVQVLKYRGERAI